jgi:hypothetical protein
LSVKPQVLYLRGSLALSLRFPDWRVRPAARYRSLAQQFPAERVWPIRKKSNPKARAAPSRKAL